MSPEPVFWQPAGLSQLKCIYSSVRLGSAEAAGQAGRLGLCAWVRMVYSHRDEGRTVSAAGREVHSRAPLTAYIAIAALGSAADRQQLTDLTMANKWRHACEGQ